MAKMIMLAYSRGMSLDARLFQMNHAEFPYRHFVIFTNIKSADAKDFDAIHKPMYAAFISQ